MINAFAAFKAGDKLQAFTYDPGTLPPDQVEIAVEYCGLCHSDMSMIDNEWGITHYPIIPGHEAIGRVSAIGDKVTQFKVGDRVGLGWSAGYCLKCNACMSGDQNYCARPVPTIIGHYGAFADKVRAQEASVVAIPEGLDSASVGPLLCAGVTVFNPLLQYGVQASDRVAIIGIGGLGHLAIKIYRAWGCEVTAFTRSESKCREALALGASRAINEKDSEMIKSLQGHFDLIISTVNVNLNWDQYIGLLKPKGRLHLVGVITEPLSINMTQLLFGQRSLSSSAGGPPMALKKLMEFSRFHQIAPVVEHYHFDQINEAIEDLRQGKAHYRIVLHW